jgi:hypothetical protein
MPREQLRRRGGAVRGAFRAPVAFGCRLLTPSPAPQTAHCERPDNARTLRRGLQTVVRAKKDTADDWSEGRLQRAFVF